MPYVKVGGLKELALRGKDAESIKVVVHPHHTSLGENEEASQQQPISERRKNDKRHLSNNKFPTDFQTHHSQVETPEQSGIVRLDHIILEALAARISYFIPNLLLEKERN